MLRSFYKFICNSSPVFGTLKNSLYHSTNLSSIWFQFRSDDIVVFHKRKLARVVLKRKNDFFPPTTFHFINRNNDTVLRYVSRSLGNEYSCVFAFCFYSCFGKMFLVIFITTFLLKSLDHTGNSVYHAV